MYFCRCSKAFKIDVLQPVYQQIALKKGIVSFGTLFMNNWKSSKNTIMFHIFFVLGERLCSFFNCE
jgi:hypothetical protein